MKPVYSYIDFRRYLADFYNEQKRIKRNFSHRFFADKAGIKSSSFLTHVINGKRNLTQSMLEKFSLAMGLNQKESLYFRHLVLFNQAKNAREKQEHYMILRNMSGLVSEKILQTKQFDLFANWYVPIIRELICLGNFQDDFLKISRLIQPKVTASQVKKTIGSLLNMKLVTKNLNGTYFPSDKVLTPNQTIFSMAVRSFVDEMITQARKAMYNIPIEERHVSSMSLGISKSCYDLLVAEIDAFKDRFKSIVSSDEGSNRVYQFNLQLFPLTKEIKADQLKRKSQ